MTAQQILSRLLRLTLALSILSACGASGTKDIVGEDTKTFIGHIAAEKKLSDRSAISIDYIGTAGSNVQSFSTGIQQNGVRVNAPDNSTIDVKSSYSFHALTAHYNYALYNGKRFKFTAAPALQISYADVIGVTDGLSPQFHEVAPAYGLKLGTSLDFTDRTRGVVELGLYDQRSKNSYITAGVWLEHELDSDLRLQLGYSQHSVGDGLLTNKDLCYSSDDLAQDCEDSEFEIYSAGVHLGIEVKR